MALRMGKYVGLEQVPWAHTSAEQRWRVNSETVLFVGPAPYKSSLL